MAVGKAEREPFWVDGQFTVRVRGIGQEPSRILRLRRPFALIGRIPGADIRIDDPSVEARHALLLLDARGVFGVDLLSRLGTRFAGAEAASSWLGAGDILEVAGRRVELLQLRVDGRTIDPPLSSDDPLGDSPELVELALEPLEVEGPPWRISSALAFVGRGAACAIRIEDDSASETHCALIRGPFTAHVVDLLGRNTRVNDAPVEGASRLLDGDVLTIGEARFTVRVGSLPSTSLVPSTVLVRRSDALEVEIDDPRGAVVARLVESMDSTASSASNLEILDVLRQFQADAATLLEAQLDRIEAMNREIAALRQEVRGRSGPPPLPAEPFRLDLAPPPTDPSNGSSTWILDRINTLEAESRTTWKDLLGRIGSTVAPRAPSTTGQSVVSTRPNSPGEPFD